MTYISFAGNLAADPTHGTTPNGDHVAEFVVIENRRRRTASGEWERGEPNRYRVKVWNQLAQNVAASLTTGAHVRVVGRIDTDRWEDKETRGQRTAQTVTAQDVALSLQYQTATAHRIPNEGGGEPWYGPDDIDTPF